jgi:hypothetical protein
LVLRGQFRSPPAQAGETATISTAIDIVAIPVGFVLPKRAAAPRCFSRSVVAWLERRDSRDPLPHFAALNAGYDWICLSNSPRPRAAEE